MALQDGWQFTVLKVAVVMQLELFILCSH